MLEPVKQPLIVEIKRNALDDGPGIRSTVFFKGCPLKCVFCHNPECIRPTTELMFREEHCIGCLNCYNVCESHAIDASGPSTLHREHCNLCSLCADECPTRALEIVGKEYAITELTQKLLRDRLFYQNSGGGVTLSGGEPTLYMDYTSSLARALKQEHIHLLLETCGYFDWENFKQKLYPYLDNIYIDLKVHDTANHLKYCGRDNARIIENIENLAREAKVDFLVRIPLVPNVTATKDNLTRTVAWLKDLGQTQVGVIPYNPLWHVKSRGIGRPITFSRKQTLSAEEKATYRNALQGLHIIGDL